MMCIKVFFGILSIAVAYQDIENKGYIDLLADKQKMRNFLLCIVDKGSCDVFGQHIKNHMVELLSDGCKECDSTQKHYAHIAIEIMRHDYPDLYEAYERKYDAKRKLLNNLDKQTANN